MVGYHKRNPSDRLSDYAVEMSQAPSTAGLIDNDAVTIAEVERQSSQTSPHRSRPTTSVSLTDDHSDRAHSKSMSGVFDGRPETDSPQLGSHRYVKSPMILAHTSAHTINQNTINPTEILTPRNVFLIAFVNANSGGKQGTKIAQTLRNELGDDHVFNLADIDPLIALEKHLHTPNLRIAVCGGDGTVNWLLSCVAALPFHPVPPVGILPLGTGNDTARVFGWGYGYVSRKVIIKNIRRMFTCPAVPFDRWHTTIIHPTPLSDAQVQALPAAMREQKVEPKFLGYKPPSKADMQDPEYRAVVGIDNVDEHAREMKFQDDLEKLAPDNQPAYSLEQLDRIGSANFITPHHGHESHSHLIKREAQFNNYLSFGVDAQIQYQFHEHRESNHHLYFNRLCNMGWMTGWGAVNLMCCMSRPLNIKIEVPDADSPSGWKELILPPGLSSVVLLNGTTYAGGRSIWGKASSKSKKGEWSGTPPSYNDGLIEIMGTKSTIHLTMMLLKVRRAIRIAQVPECRITTLSPIHAQLDGEPWDEQHAIYHVRRIHQALVLDGTKN